MSDWLDSHFSTGRSPFCPFKQTEISSGNLLQFAIEYGPVENSEFQFSHEKLGDFP